MTDNASPFRSVLCVLRQLTSFQINASEDVVYPCCGRLASLSCPRYQTCHYGALSLVELSSCITCLKYRSLSADDMAVNISTINQSINLFRHTQTLLWNPVFSHFNYASVTTVSPRTIGIAMGGTGCR